MNSAPPPAEKKSNTLKIVLIGVAVVFVLVIGIVGVLAAVGIFGARSYISKAKASEGKAGVSQLARGIASCAQKETTEGPVGLPASTPWVPARASDVSGKKYQSAPTDWNQPGFKCAGFSMMMPQYFQYRWERDSKNSGRARAQADFDGDGVLEVKLEAKVNCSAGVCMPDYVKEL